VGRGAPVRATCKVALLTRLQGILTLCLQGLPCSLSHARCQACMCLSPSGEQLAVRSRLAPQSNLPGSIVEGKGKAQQRRVPDQPWYSFDQGLVHVAVLSSEHIAQVEWLEQDLAALTAPPAGYPHPVLAGLALLTLSCTIE
jgi:hypothetical protein